MCRRATVLTCALLVWGLGAMPSALAAKPAEQAPVPPLPPAITLCQGQSDNLQLAASGYATVCVQFTSEKDLLQVPALSVRATRVLPSGSTAVPCVPGFKQLWGPSRLLAGKPEEAVYEISGCGTTVGTLNAKLVMPGAPSAIGLTLLPPTAASAMSILRKSSLLAGLWFFIALLVLLVHHYRWNDVMGPAGWDFGQSWASNLTAAGSILGFIVTSVVYPDRPIHLSKENYLALNGLTLALAGLAPFVHKVFSRTTVVQEAGVQVQGRVYGFLFACAITVWSVLAQLWTQYYVLDEARLALTAFEQLVPLLRSILLGLGAMVLWYAWRTFLVLAGSGASRAAGALPRVKMQAFVAESPMPQIAASRRVPLL